MNTSTVLLSIVSLIRIIIRRRKRRRRRKKGRTQTI